MQSLLDVLVPGEKQAPLRGGESALSRWLPAVNPRDSPNSSDQHTRGDRPANRQEQPKALREPDLSCRLSLVPNPNSDDEIIQLQ